MGVVHSLLMYPAPVWVDIVKVKKYRMLMERCQRKALLRLASAYWTVSSEALFSYYVDAPDTPPHEYEDEHLPK